MPITLTEYKHKRTGTRYHSDKGAWVGYLVDINVGGKRYRNKRFPTKSEAEKYVESLKLETTYRRSGLKFNRAEAPRISELSAKRIALIKNKAEKVRAVRIFDYFTHVCETDLKVAEVRAAHLQSFINQRASDGVKPETINREMNILSTLLKTASEIFPDALDGYEPPRIPRPRFKKKGRTRVVTEIEKNLIYNFLTSSKIETETTKVFENRIRIARMFEIAWLLGLRFGEVSKLEKKDFNFENKILRVFRHKTGATTLFEFLPAFICEKIKEAAAASESEFIYTISGNYPKNFYPIIKDAVESVGLEYGRDNPNGITFHSNRHSFTTRLIQSTDLATAASLTGHSDKAMLGYYSHASDASKRGAMNKMYGNSSELELIKLREIFYKVQNKQMNFDEFCAVFSDVKF